MGWGEGSCKEERMGLDLGEPCKSLGREGSLCVQE